MAEKWNNIAPAIKEETRHVAVSTGIMTALMWLVFFVLHLIYPDKIPFNYTVFLGGICGCAVAVLNFFLMGLTVQSVVDTGDEDSARAKMKASLMHRRLLQAGWIIIAIAAPCFQIAASIAPLLFPGFGIRLRPVWAMITARFKKPENNMHSNE